MTPKEFLSANLITIMVALAVGILLMAATIYKGRGRVEGQVVVSTSLILGAIGFGGTFLLAKLPSIYRMFFK